MAHSLATYFLQFRTNNKIENALEITYMNKTIRNVPSVKFLGLLVDDTLSWDQHINQIASKLSSVNSLKTELCVLCSMDTYPTTIKKCSKDVILLLCPFNHFL